MQCYYYYYYYYYRQDFRQATAGIVLLRSRLYRTKWLLTPVKALRVQNLICKITGRIPLDVSNKIYRTPGETVNQIRKSSRCKMVQISSILVATIVRLGLSTEHSTSAKTIDGTTTNSLQKPVH